jgi:Fuc2NAc and GlcNAc transferase
VIGFLLWNRPPARIFLGDVGSTFLGFVLGMLALSSIAQGLLSPWVWLILGGVFIVDATLTLLRRMLQGERWHEAHRSHAYQKATSRLAFHFEKSKGFVTERALARAHGLVTLLILALNILWLLPMAYAAQYWPAWGLGFVFVAWLPLLLLALHLEAGALP